MLKGIDRLLHADLLHLLAAMGHGDEGAIIDHNFPAVAMSRRLVRLDGADLRTAGRPSSACSRSTTSSRSPWRRRHERD